VANGVVYFSSQDGKAYALNSSTGAVLWTYPTGHANGPASSAVANGMVYFTPGINTIYAFGLN
jgi:outer membrane protein assembly factor BamB